MIPRACRSGRRHSTWSVVAQLQLFPVTAVAPPQHREPCKKKGETAGKKGDIDLPTVQRIVPAAGAAMPKSLGPCSVFAMASALGSKPAQAAPAASDQPAPIGRIIVREDGITRHTAVRLQDTEEWAEKERQRRARQRPPRPPRQKFKMKGSRAWAENQS